MTFKIGMPVVCIKRGFWEQMDPGAFVAKYPLYQEVYIVDDIIRDEEGEFLRLRGFDWMTLWYSPNFRPVVSPKQQVSFTTGAPRDSRKWGNRRKRVEVVS